MDRREAIVYLAGLAAFEFLQTQPDQTLGTIQHADTHAPGSYVQTNALMVVKQKSVPHTAYVALAECCALENGLDPVCFVNQINQESGFNPAAVSPAGAIGIAQFMPETAAGLGINPYDPVQSLHGAACLMAHYVAHYGRYDQALAAYNAGSGAVSYALRQGGPNWRVWLPLETQHYIAAILEVR